MGWGRTGQRRSESSWKPEEQISCVLALLLLARSENPIEEAFSKIKGIVRKVGARTREALEEAIAAALCALTPEDAAGWFAHAGYWPQDQPL
jgi:hypothetical protein